MSEEINKSMTQEEMDTRMLEVLSGEGVALGWDDAEGLINEQRVGLFIKLDSGESVDLAFRHHRTSIISYYAHRVPIIGDDGRPVLDGDGNSLMGFSPCSFIYGDDGCEHCETSVAKSLRTVAEVVVARDGVPTNEVSLLEGGPQLFKTLIVPQVRSWGFSHLYRLTRKGTGLKTKYIFGPIPPPNGAMKPALVAQVKGLESPNVMEAVRLMPF